MKTDLTYLIIFLLLANLCVGILALTRDKSDSYKEDPVVSN